MDAYLLGLGSNLGDREYYIDQAIDAIRSKCGEVTAIAPLLETAPWGGTADLSFLNTAIICETSLQPLAMLDQLLAIESDLGRIRSERWGNRTLDCDIILWRRAPGDYPCFKDARLSIPHPEAKHRSFVLEPCAAIAGDWIHPEAGLSLKELWVNLAKSSQQSP